jgi:hypothetical protein
VLPLLRCGITLDCAEVSVVQGSKADKGQEVEDQFTQAMTEVHSVVPGVFALFGFQLIAAFNDVFQKLAPAEKAAYSTALVLLGASAALLMTPAAYHRQVRPHSVSDAFANLISRLLTWAMYLLVPVFPIDGYLVTKVASKSTAAASLTGLALLAMFVFAWIVFPARKRREHRGRRDRLRAEGRDLEPA